MACSEQSEGIFFAPRDDTGVIAFVLGSFSELEVRKGTKELINLEYSRIEFARLPRSARNDDVI